MLLADSSPFSFSGEGLKRALAGAHLPALMPALACLTGDMSAIDPAWQPDMRDQAQRPLPQAGLSERAQSLARDKAFALISSWQASGKRTSPAFSGQALEAAMHFITGQVDASLLGLLRHELGVAPAPGIDSPPRFGLPADFTVAVIGAGMSGLAASWHLSRLGIRHTVLERHAELGGVWVENTYPGCRLDTSNFCYSYSFAQQANWRHFFSPRDEVRRYFHEVAGHNDLIRHIQFNTHARTLQYDDAACKWRIRCERAGECSTLEANVVISAVGQLNKPRLPAIAGLARFRGPSWHTARWRHDIKLDGLRVGVVGTGASAFQVIPQIAPIARSLTVFQRTPPWVVHTPSYTRELPEGLHWLLSNLPGYNAWYRFEQFWVAVEGRRHYSTVDPNWQRAGSVSALNLQLREMLEADLERAYAGRPDLQRLMTPSYPPYSKRMLRDDGTWSEALKRPNVTVVTAPITEATESGLSTRDGTLHELDALIFGTGFHASHFLSSLEVKGLGGLDLHQCWGADPKAYQGVCVPGFPNLFMLYGPNTNLITNGSLVLFSEIEIEYVLRCLKFMAENRARAIACTADASRLYNERVDRATRLMAYGVEGVSNWYKSETGRVTQNWPFSTADFWRQMQQVRADDFELHG